MFASFHWSAALGLRLLAVVTAAYFAVQAIGTIYLLVDAVDLLTR